MGKSVGVGACVLRRPLHLGLGSAPQGPHAN
jgi:hypothetical protein